MPKWLIVEDEPILYEILPYIFELWSIDGIIFRDITSVGQWIESVNTSKFSDQLPQLALLGTSLPNIDKLGVATQLRQSDRLKDIIIVLISDHLLLPKDEKTILEESRADLLLYKPLATTISELEAILNRIII